MTNRRNQGSDGGGCAPENPAESNYLEPFASRVAGRSKRPLGDMFGLQTFGANHTTLAPGTESRAASHPFQGR